MDLGTLPNLTFVELGKAIGFACELSEEFAKQIFRELTNLNSTSPMFDGIADVLQELSRRHLIVILSSNVQQNIQRTLSTFAPNLSVVEIVDGQQGGSKSEKIINSMRNHRCSPAETYMIGDTVGDICHGRNAGVLTVAVTWGYQSEDFLRQANPDHIVRTPEELLSVLP